MPLSPCMRWLVYNFENGNSFLILVSAPINIGGIDMFSGTDMFGAIKDEVSKINNPDIEIDDDNAELALEQEYEKLQNIKINIEDLDTNMSNDEMDDESFNKLRDLIVNGNNIVDAYRNVLPVNILNKTKKTINAYSDELIEAIVSADDANEYRAGLDLIIKNLSVIDNGKEYTIQELKDKFDSKYN